MISIEFMSDENDGVQQNDEQFINHCQKQFCEISQ